MFRNYFKCKVAEVTLIAEFGGTISVHWVNVMLCSREARNSGEAKTPRQSQEFEVKSELRNLIQSIRIFH